MARRYTIQCSVPNTQTRCTLSWTAGGRQAGRGQARSEKGRRVGGMEQGMLGEGGREQYEGWREGGGRRVGGSQG